MADNDLEYYRHCHKVSIKRNGSGWPSLNLMLGQLRDMKCERDYDFTMETIYMNGSLVVERYDFYFDDPRKAVAFKLVWG